MCKSGGRRIEIREGTFLKFPHPWPVTFAFCFSKNLDSGGAAGFFNLTFDSVVFTFETNFKGFGCRIFSIDWTFVSKLLIFLRANLSTDLLDFTELRLIPVGELD